MCRYGDIALKTSPPGPNSVRPNFSPVLGVYLYTMTLTELSCCVVTATGPQMSVTVQPQH